MDWTKEKMVRNRTLPGKYMVGSWQDLQAAEAQDALEKQVITTQRLKVVRCNYKADSEFIEHVHEAEQITIVESGLLQFNVGGEHVDVAAGQMISIFPRVPHSSKVGGGEGAQALNLFQSTSPEIEA